jgi:hypothetical protein
MPQKKDSSFLLIKIDISSRLGTAVVTKEKGTIKIPSDGP